MRKIILDLCGGTGSWSKPYRDNPDEYDVRVITLPANDVTTFIPPDEPVYGILAATPCDQFSIAKHFHGKGNYKHDFRAGLEVAAACCRVILTCKPKFWAMENPANGLLKRWMKEPAMIFEPWMWGDNYQKVTALWGGVQLSSANCKREATRIEKILDAIVERNLSGILRDIYQAGTQVDNAAWICKSVL